MSLKNLFKKRAERPPESAECVIPAQDVPPRPPESAECVIPAQDAPTEDETPVISNLPAISKSEVSTSLLQVHSDISNLLWILDGPKKNISRNPPKQYVMEIEGLRIPVSFKMSWEDEPSMISVSLPIQLDINPSDVVRPSYYPRYEELTPEQRGVYWRYLRNPYDNTYDVGYAFLLYYGLERHLLCGDFERAFEVILKMRDTFSNKSFQGYSANAIILSCAARKRGDVLERFMQSLDKEHEYQFDRNLFLICKSIEGNPLTAKELMSVSTAVPGCNRNYIKKYPDIYEKELNLIAPAGVTLPMLHEPDHEVELKVFANTSLGEITTVPDLLSDPAITETLASVLSKAHENTKRRLALMRKAGNAPKEKPAKKREIRIDWKLRDQLNEDYNSNEPGSIDRHFAINGLIDFYYKLREISEDYLNRCIELCREDIDSLDSLQENYRAQQIAEVSKYRAIMGNELADSRLAETDMEFKGNIPAFKRLAIIYEKDRDYESAESICREAIHYYAKYGMASLAEEFIERQSKITAKKSKLKNKS